VEPDWPTCGVEPCTGIQVESYGTCLAHLNSRQLDEFLDGLRPGSDIDARGTTITESLLERLLYAVRKYERSRMQTFGLVRFERARFTGEANFDGSTFLKEARFHEAEFHGTVLFTRLNANKVVRFVDARFMNGAFFGVQSASLLDFDRARLAGPVEIAGDVTTVACNSTWFEDGVNLRLGGTVVYARKTMFGGASSIVLDLLGAARRADPPRLVSLRATDVSNLELVDVDLRQCDFNGAYRLDQLRIAGRCRFNTPPASWRWTRRQIIAEEAAWRGWPSSDHANDMGPERVAAVYRSLRKALEDSKNEAGAGDFYYGEMDARRHSRETRRTERWILWFYWLLSGYGQRAGRALIALLVLIATVATMLTVWGQPAENAARIAVGAVVFRDDRTELTTAGEWTVLVARFLGPVLLALAVLAVRARVKR
jgi:uncharacterized protein YjbI with pentapeptide repeats